MKIVVLDGYCLNPGDLTWEGVEEFGELTVHERTLPGMVVERAEGAAALLTNKTPVSRDDMAALDGLKYIGLLATGYNVVDVVAARARGIVVTNVPSYGTMSVAQMVFSHLLDLTQHCAGHAKTVRNGKWCESDDFCYWDHPLIELSGLCIGIIGYGRIGSAAARIALSFGMRVLVCDTDLPQELPEGAQRSGLDELFRQSDVVSLHCPLTPETDRLVNRDRLALMKRSAFLINTSRGQLVDEQALADALNRGGIAGAGLDVLSIEPPSRDNPLLNAKNCSVTPHIAWASKAARQRLMDVVVEKLKAFVENNPVNVVNP